MMTNKKLRIKGGQTNISHTSSLIFASVLIFIFLFGFSHAQVGCDKDTDCPFGQVCGANDTCRECVTSAECLSKTFLTSTLVGGASPWFTISITVVVMIFFAVALFYMVAYAFQSDQFKRIAFGELMQVVASFILIAMLFGFDMFEQDLVTQLEKTSGAVSAALVYSTGGSPSTAALSGQIQISPFDVSYAFLRNMLDCTENGLKNAYERSKIYETMMNMQLQFIIELPILKLPTPINPFAYISSFSEKAAMYEYDANELTWLAIFLYAQIAVLNFIETSMFTLFLPVGLILRSFPPTRGAGAVMVAVAIGFYVVYPLIFTILYVGTPPVIDGCVIAAPLDVQTTSETCPVDVGAVSDAISSAADTGIILDAEMPRIEAGMTSMRFAALVYMIISLGGTFIFVRSFSSILGADISEIGRSMFRMM